MGFQNENKLELGTSVKATINDKVVEAKVINIRFNRVTLRSQKGNEATYAFNSEKFLKWFKEVPLNEVANNHAETSGDDLLKNVKIVTSGPSVKERTSTPKEKEDRFKLAFRFRDVDEEGVSMSEFMLRDYTLTERKSRLGALLSPMFFEGSGNQATAIILTALYYAKGLNKHSDAEWLSFIENRDLSLASIESFDDMLMGDVTLICKVIETYAKNLKRPDGKSEGVTLEEWARFLPRNKEEAKFVAQLLCDGGINK
ncbi:hypothetical protein JQ494_01355, partial [Helicobacter pylori]|uniref:hypothetical protein n=1 Tax=Helicobacter pylori TaxID=210 RepID=UPI001939C735